MRGLQGAFPVVGLGEIARGGMGSVEERGKGEPAETVGALLDEAAPMEGGGDGVRGFHNIELLPERCCLVRVTLLD
jgi:hypothetical protein